ncbi:MAG: hypothetical protein K2N84_01735 [Clostridia bacterium]|nr:hypothetical protein [Clostridia bacterium]
MRKIKQFFKGGAIIALASAMLLGAAGCDGKEKPPVDDPDNPSQITPVPKVQVSITATADEISGSESVTYTATVENSDKGVTWSVSDPAMVRITDGGVVTILKAPELVDKNVTVTATSVEDPNVTASKALRVKAPKQEGSNGNLTAEMLEKIGNASITATGTVTDYYVDTKQSYNNSTNYYDSVVTMEDGKWSGSWGYKPDMYTPATELMTDVYVRGESGDVKDAAGRVGHAMERLYINKDNEVARATEKNYVSIPVLWEENHLYNHLANLPLAAFTYNPDDLTKYTYEVDENSEDSLYLMTYLAFSLTPMLEETIKTVVLTVEDGEITNIAMQTSASYSGATTDQQGNVVSYDSMSYTTVSLTFSEIGTAKVQEPTPYEAPENADKLTAALNNMKAAKSYTYQLEDVTTFAPSGDDDDYTYMSVNGAAASLAARVATPLASKAPDTVSNNNSASGTVGTRGWVTEDAILIGRTTKYSYSMDDRVYRTEYSGYRQFDGYYEAFEWNKDVKDSSGNAVGGMKGVKRVEGNMMDAMPKFDFSANVFEYVGMRAVQGKPRYTFRLRETAITRDIAMQVSAYSYADSAKANSSASLEIVVDGDGHLISTKYPYSITMGTYLGYCTTNYMDINDTTINMETMFANYEERGAMATWNLYTMKYFRNSATEISKDENAQVAINSIFGSVADSVPAPTTFMKIFGDNMSGPFCDDDTRKNANGDDVFYRWMSLTARSTEFDENSQVTNFDDIMAKADAAFTEAGLQKNYAKTDVSGGPTGRYNRYLVYNNAQITVVIENNFTKNFWIYIYKTSDYNALKA